VSEHNRWGNAISELRGRALVEGASKMRLSDKPQRDWAARTIRRLRREVRFLKLTASALGEQLESERPASELWSEEWMK
jgi:hypothetical protein